MYDIDIWNINLNDVKERDKVNSFLNDFNLILDKDVDYTIAAKNNNGDIIATASKWKNILKCFAVSEEYRGENLTSVLITSLIDKLFEEGIYHAFIFTKPNMAKMFINLNFKLIYEVDKAVLLEFGLSNIDGYLKKLVKSYNIEASKTRGAVVMNCNPFTSGHRFLVEQAAEACEEVLVFVVEEDKSIFPFKYRYELVKKGVEDLKNVKVIQGGEYIISSATFPSYFLREEDERLKAYEEIDGGIFGKYFCNEFNIKKRFVGEEPYCNVTNTYNETLKEVLPRYGVELVELKRKEYNKEYISASKVRALIREGKINEIKNMIPEVTWEFLNSEEGRDIVEKIKVTNSPH